MSSIFSVNELAVVLLVRNQNPALLNLDFLKHSGIVPQDWELASPPILTQHNSQVTFQNGLRLIADTNRTIFIENITGKSLSNVIVPQIAKLYVQVLRHAEYEAIGINPEGFATFPHHPELAQNYVCTTLLAPGKWLEFGNHLPRVDMNISYTLEHRTLNLRVCERLLQKEDKDLTTPIVNFAGNFEYPLQHLALTNRLGVLCNVLEQWHRDIETFTTLIKQRFLNELNPPFPGKVIDSLTGQIFEVTHS